MKAEIMSIIEKHTPTTTYVDGANAADEIIELFDQLKKENEELKGKTRLEKIEACNQCFSVGILDSNCVCAVGSYKTIELEFEVCNCCNNLIEDGSPADTEFNKKQLKKEK